MKADPISAVQCIEQEREIIQTATKDMLTLNSADETDKSDNTTEHSPQWGSTNQVQVTDSDVIMITLWKTCPLSLPVATSLTDYIQISIM